MHKLVLCPKHSPSSLHLEATRSNSTVSKAGVLTSALSLSDVLNARIQSRCPAALERCHPDMFTMAALG